MCRRVLCLIKALTPTCFWYVTLDEEKKSPPPLPDLRPRLPLPLIRKTIHGPATPTFLVGLSTGASICSNPSRCHSRAAINPIIIFLTSRADGANWQICILDRVKPKQRRAELRSPFHFNAGSLGCLRSGRSFPLPSPPLLGMEACGGWWGVSSVPVFLSTASHVSWSGSMSSPARCAACEAAEEPPRCDKTRGSRQLVFFCFFFLQRGSRVLICDQEANEQMLHYPPTHTHTHYPSPHLCLCFCITRITTTRGWGNERLVDAMSVEGGRYDAVHRERRACVGK